MDLKQVLEKVNDGKGTIGTLINDTASANSVQTQFIERGSDYHKNSTKTPEALKHNFLFSRYLRIKKRKRRRSWANKSRQNLHLNNKAMRKRFQIYTPKLSKERGRKIQHREIVKLMISWTILLKHSFCC
ncbi:MAG: hypothetical protein IPH78_15115 [Bacteroidetes bacterium]|nr:hypothetical protein [Bacteroidota bacterium]